MEIAKQLAGFSPAEAGRSPEGDRQEDPLADGVLEGQVPRGVRNGVTPAVANQLWKDMEQAQDYSFNKSRRLLR